MHKSNANSEMIFDNNNEKDHRKKNQNIRFIDNFMFTLLQERYYSSIFQRNKLALYSKSLEKDDKVTSQAVCFISLEKF